MPDKDYLHPKRYPSAYPLVLQAIRDAIADGLRDHPNFEGVDFCDVSAGGIHVRGHHREVKGHTYGEQPLLQYDMSNAVEVVDKFIEAWKKMDDEKTLRAYKAFIEDCDKWGWD